MLALLNNGLPIIYAEDTALLHPQLVSMHGLFYQAAAMVTDFLAEYNTCILVRYYQVLQKFT